MIHFVVVTGAPGSVSRLSERLVPALDETQIFEGERVVRTGASGTWSVSAISRPDPVCQVRFAATDDSFVVVNGPAFTRDGVQANLVDELLHTFRHGGTTGVAASLCGTYNFVGADQRQGVRAFGDCSALYPLYWHQGDGASVISNRSSTVASVAGTSSWNAHALGWVIGRANLFGDDVPAEGVRHIPGGHEAQADWGASRIRTERSPEWIWPEPSDGGGRESLSATEWDEITDELVSATRRLGELDVPIRLALTGGKDSRVSLALAKAAGLQDAVLAYTSGGRRHPETEYAVDVAAAAGFRHKDAPADGERVHAEVGKRPAQAADPNSEWRRLQQQVHRYEGIVAAWSDRSTWAPPETVTIEGFVGELYRNGHESLFDKPHLVTLDNYLSMFPLYHQAGRRAGVQLLTAGEERFQTDWIERWVRTAADEVRLDVLPIKFFVDNRLAHWTGPLLQNTASVTINPLSSANAARKVLDLSLLGRSQDSFHLEVLRRTAPELIDVPLYSKEWASPQLEHQSRRRRRQGPSQQPPGIHALTKHRPVWSFLASEGEAIARLFDTAAQRTELGSICDVDKAIALARRSGEQQNARARELLCCVGVAISMLGLAERVVVDTGGTSDRSDPGSVGQALLIATGKHSDAPERVNPPAPGPTTGVARTGSRRLDPIRLEPRLTDVWRKIQPRLPPPLAGAIRAPAKRLLRRLGVRP